MSERLRLPCAVVFASLAVAGCGLFPDLGGLSGGCVGACGDASSDSPTAADASTDASPGVDGSGNDGSTGAPHFVQSGNDTSSTASLPIAISSSGAGHLLVVAVTQESGTTAVITSITDNAPGGSATYVSANQRSIDANCNNTVEIWYAKDSSPGATSVTITMSAAVDFEGWAAEFSGLSTSSPLDTGAATNSSGAATITAPQVTPSVAPSLIVSTAATCGAASGIHAGNPFTALPIQNGEDTAYYVASTTGSYGAVWDYSGGSWNASTVAFK